MTNKYYEDTDSLYINLLNKQSVCTDAYSDGSDVEIQIDFDKGDELVGIGIEHVSGLINCAEHFTPTIPAKEVVVG